ncbi:DUF317 domain-containing protein [Streptomyces acidiscabies]|uniref:DUF317 domain-containing protein n=1 Tax=Streptomyces acidiscabies TaxID=42234 RepID=A0AAP6BIZ0_9ACTN|nr:DUF317 domain-containing protein [Streptomyces acidiscabies]MBP5935396.1 DUF317 domain-containing protein [Streptomyces sp. LBUM 1476]MBZ3916755.1 DUF317 domain-containing protein [Streptomyces acidiscabies]MDX2965607.1 DUF317 domain-containing protein [Streptomyces acidiscabies]MDX3024891.1 DUF317 domain-containing protein [Streptomyces acidiscabies]MDX3795523.1 DUF317 domain-containing protein [Streptomyces acidiscabies]
MTDPDDGDVYVFPRHLARTTATGDPALAPLLGLGWEPRHDDLGNVHLAAPDGTIRLGYLPEGEDDGLWRINAYDDPYGPPAWGICCNADCPTELVTAVTTVLATAYRAGPDTYLARPVAVIPDRDPFQTVSPLIRSGWLFDRPEPGIFAIRSPDGLARLEYNAGPLRPDVELTSRTARWHLWTGTDADRPLWYATATTDTPVTVLTAITAWVSDPAPLLRWQDATFSYAKNARLTPVLPPRPPVPTPLDVQRPRRTPALTTSSVPRWSTTSRPALPGPRR